VSTLPDGSDSDTTVLVARLIDAGWISTISQVAPSPDGFDPDP
jgi:hypothetical protein